MPAILKPKPNSYEKDLKYQQVVDTIVEAVHRKKLRRGDRLPSVRDVCKEFSLSRDTVSKAYGILKNRGIIDATPRKGYSVATESVKHTVKVFLMMDTFRQIKKDVYDGFMETVEDKAAVDICFHHYNPKTFESQILDNIGKYGYYVIVPLLDDASVEVLRKINPDQLLVLDMQGKVGLDCSYVTQNFDQAVYDCLTQGLDRIRKYQSFNLVYDAESVHPSETSSAFHRFSQDNNIAGSIIRVDKLRKNHEIQKGEAFFVINDDHLIEIIEACNEKGFTLGEDVGVVSYNEKSFKKVLCGGITTISTDFVAMGKAAAGLALQRGKKTHIVTPTEFIVRRTL